MTVTQPFEDRGLASGHAVERVEGVSIALLSLALVLASQSS